MAHVLAAESAHALQDAASRDRHLQQVLDEALQPGRGHGELADGARLRAANWALDDQAPQDALQWLEQLPQGVSRRMVTLRTRLKAARLAGLPMQALDTARALIRHRAFTPEAGTSLLRSLAGDALRQAHDLTQLEKTWRALEPAERIIPEVVCVAAQRALQVAPTNNRSAGATLARQWIEGVWPHYASMGYTTRERLVGLLEASLDDADTAWLARIEAAQQRLPHDANLQYLAGMACVRRQLWGKAQLLLSSAATGLSDERMRRHTWATLSTLAEARGDFDASQAALAQAAALR